MNDDLVAIIDLADELQVRKQRIFNGLKRLGINPTLRRDADRGRSISLVTAEEARAIRREIGAISGEVGSSDGPALLEDVGFFYLIRLEPMHDPGRFKVGFTMELEGRLQKHRCSAPFAEYIKTWPCRRVWERAAIDCAARDCERLHTEVFRAGSLDAVASRAATFFSVMPSLVVESDVEPGEDGATPDNSRPEADRLARSG